jgi:hypothetical protein
MLVKIEVVRDARARHSTIVDVDSVEAARANFSRHGYDSPHSQWVLEGTECLDNADECIISDLDGNEIDAFRDSSWSSEESV